MVLLWKDEKYKISIFPKNISAILVQSLTRFSSIQLHIFAQNVQNWAENALNLTPDALAR